MRCEGLTFRIETHIVNDQFLDARIKDTHALKTSFLCE